MTPREVAERVVGGFAGDGWESLETCVWLRDEIEQALSTAYARGSADMRERAAKEAERIWDESLSGAHGGEQANRTAAAIRALPDIPSEGR